MKRLLTLVAFFATLQASAQQVNPVPDYVFRNQMSVGRGTVTDTAAYFSIGPRYGATKGFMPPIVGDTATFSSGKRNGLLIFSVQKNKFLYWDSVRVQWSDMAGSSGAYIVAGDTSAMLAPYLRKVDTTSMLTAYLRKADTTAMLSPYYRSATASAALALKLNISDTSSMLANYIRHAGYGLTKSGQSFLVDTLNIATRAWRQKGLDSLAALEVSGSGTTNYVAKFTAGSTIGNSQIFDNGTNVGLGTASPGAKFHLLSATGTAQTQGDYANNLAIMQGASRTGTTSVGGSFATTLSLQSNDDVITAGSGASIGFAAKWNTGLYSSAAQFGSIFGGKENSTDANLAGYLSFATRPAGGNPTERLRITSGGDVGVSQPSLLWTATNRRLLEINGTSQSLIGLNVNNLKAGYIWQNGNDMTIATENAGYIQFGTNGSSDRMRIFSNGRVGINTTTDAGYQLDVNGTLRTVNGANFATTSGSIGIGTASPSASSKVTISSATGYGIELDNTATGGLKWQIGSSADDFGAGGGKFLITYGNNSLVSPFTIVQSTSNIGISTTSPSYKLDINGTLRSANGANFATTSGRVGVGTASPQYLVEAYQNGLSDVIVNSAADNNSAILSVFNSGGTSGNFAQLRAYGNTTGGTLFGSSTNKMISLFSNGDALMTIGTISATSLAFGTANAERARFSGAGELLINTTSDAGDYKLQVSGNIYNTGSAVLAATSGNVGIGTASPVGDGTALNIYGSSFATIKLQNSTSGATATDGTDILVASSDLLIKNRESGAIITYTANTERGRINSAGEWIIDASGTDAGDYKLQVVGNARIGTGKLDIASNTTFGIGVARSGTSEVAGQIYNSNGILYLGAESSAGGQIFSGSSAYAAVIGSGANYPLQFAANNITRATLTTNGNFMIGFPTDTYFYRLQVNGSIFSNNQIIAQNAAAQLNIDSSTNISPLYISNQSLTGSSAQGLFYGSTTWNTTGNPSLVDLAITNTASGSDANYIKISDGSNIFRVTKAAEVVTAAPTGGSIRKWKLGEAATVSPTSPNRTIRVEIDGTVYYLHAKTTND